jgi:Peptidase family M23
MSSPPTVVSSSPQPSSGGSPPEPKTATFADANPDVLTFVNRRATITVPIATCKLERTIEGASSLTVTIHDPALSFLNCEAIQGPKHGEIEGFVTLENLVFAIAGVHLLKGHMVEVVLEDEAVHRLRRNKKALTMSRGSVTRAQFIKHMFAESGISLISPELDKKQPQETPAESRKQKDKKHKPGLSDHAKLTIKQQPIDSEQRANLETALAQAVSDNAGSLATLALIVAGIGESTWRKGEVAHSQNGAQVGPLQSDQIPADRVAEQCHYFLVGGKSFQGGGAIHLAKTQPTLTPGDIATQVEASGEPGDFYNVWKPEAEQIVNAFTGEDAGALQNVVTFVKEYQYERKAGEDSWAAARRLAEEVGWYLFIVDGVGHFYSGEYLKRSRPLMLVAPGADGLIGNPTFGYMTSHRYDDTVTVECHAAKWGSPPGSIAELEGYGPVDGRWVVTTIERPRMKSSVTIIELGRGKLPKKEPAHTVVTSPASSVPGTEGMTNPFARVANLVPERVDMGVDYSGTGPIVALADGEITFANDKTGWAGGGCVVLKITSGPFTGKFVYHAESITVHVKVGDKVTAGQVLATMNGGTESGWASGNEDEALAASLNQQAPGDPGSWESAAGASFNRLLVHLGCKPGTVNPGGGPHGHMPPGYP